jgi:hypothetical protein
MISQLSSSLWVSDVDCYPMILDNCPRSHPCDVGLCEEIELDCSEHIVRIDEDIVKAEFSFLDKANFEMRIHPDCQYTQIIFKFM